MEDKNDMVEISAEEYQELYACKVRLMSATKAIKRTMDKDGELKLVPKCVDLLLQIMEG